MSFPNLVQNEVTVLQLYLVIKEVVILRRPQAAEGSQPKASHRARDAFNPTDPSSLSTCTCRLSTSSDDPELLTNFRQNIRRL